MHEPVMLSTFDFDQAKLREAFRSLNWRVLLAMNEILRRSAPQNDVDQEPVIARDALPISVARRLITFVTAVPKTRE